MVEFRGFGINCDLILEVCVAKKASKKVVKNPSSRDKTGKHQESKRISASELETYKSRLIALRDRIRNDVSTMADGALSQSRSESAGDLSIMPLHMADIGTDNFEQEQTLSFIQSDHATLTLIEEALVRIKDGTYGICEDCGAVIPKVRLNVLPYTASCVHCVNLAHQNQ